MNGVSSLIYHLSVDFLYLASFLGLSHILTQKRERLSIFKKTPQLFQIWVPSSILGFFFIGLTFYRHIDMSLGFFFIPALLLFFTHLGYILFFSHESQLVLRLKSFLKIISWPFGSLIFMILLRDIYSLSVEILLYMTTLIYILHLILEIINLKKNFSFSIPHFLFVLTALLFFSLGQTTLSVSKFQAAVFFGFGSILAILCISVLTVIRHYNGVQQNRDPFQLWNFDTHPSNSSFQSALNLSEDGLWEFNLESDTMSISKPLQDWLCIETDFLERAADFWIDRVHPRDWHQLLTRWMPEDFQSFRKKLRNMTQTPYGFEIQMSSQEGIYKWVRIQMMVSISGNRTYIHGSFKDIDSEKRARAQVARLSQYDTTTGLPNFDSMLTALSHSLAKETDHALIFINIDNFKTVNDIMGFFKGDEILAKIGQSLSEDLPEHAQIFRFGGDEFAVITDQPQEAKHIVQSIRFIFDRRLCDHEFCPNLTCSMSVTLFPTAYAYDSESILKCSDIAMAEVKNEGKNNYIFFNSSMTDSMEKRHKLIYGIEAAYKNRAFMIHYQFLSVPTASEQTIHAEALLRWEFQGRMVSPAEFIPIAEETGLIVNIGRMIFSQICCDIARMQALGYDLYVSVNVSAVQLKDVQLITDLQQAMEAHGVSPSQVTLEITETSLIYDTERVRTILDTLKQLGVRISLDDFGTGFSSLSHILHLPIDELKLDRSFIQNFYQDPKRQNVIQSLIDLAHGLDLIVVAEGVEVEEEATLLKEYDCDILQGFYYARPAPLDVLIQSRSHTA